MERRTVHTLAAAALTAVLVAGCARSPAATASRNGHLTVSIQGDPSTLDPVLTQTATEFDVLNNTMEGLVRIDSSGVPQGGIAKSWTVGPRGLTYTFTLRNAVWSNGDPVTATDFVDAWQQAVDPRTAAPYASDFSYIQGSAALLNMQLPNATAHPNAYQAAVAKIPGLLDQFGVQAPNAQTLVVHLAQPTPYWVSLTALPPYFPVDGAFVQKVGAANYGGSAQDVLSDGPFMLTSWVHNGQLVLARNPRYWDASAVRLSQVTMLEVTQPATEINLWASGKLGAMLPSIPQAYVAHFQGQPGFHSAADATTAYVVTNTAKGVFSNTLIRQAFSLAVDRQSLATNVVQGNALPAYALVPPVIDYTPGKPFTQLVGKVLGTTANDALAKQDLAAGLKALGLSSLPTVTLLTLNNSSQQTQGQALQAMWETALGITVQVDPLGTNTFFADLGQGQFELGLLGWNADYNDPTTFLGLFQGNSSMNLTGWNDASFNSDLNAAAGATTATQRGADLAAASQVLLSQLPAIPLYWTSRNWMVQTDVHGLVVYPTGPDYSLKWTWIGPASS